MTDPTIHKLADAYARTTTCTRCADMGHCQACTIKYCDYRARLQAYLAGYQQAFTGLNITYTPPLRYGKDQT